MKLDLQLAPNDRASLEAALKLIQAKLAFEARLEELPAELIGLSMLMSILSTYSIDIVFKQAESASPEQMAFAVHCQKVITLFNELKAHKIDPTTISELWVPKNSDRAVLTEDNIIACQAVSHLFNHAEVDISHEVLAVICRMLKQYESHCVKSPMSLQQFIKSIQEGVVVLKPEQFRQQTPAPESARPIQQVLDELYMPEGAVENPSTAKKPSSACSLQ